MPVPLRNEGEQLKNVGNREINWYVTWNFVLRRHLQSENIYNKDQTKWMKKTFGINPIFIKETKKAKWTYQNRDSINEASKFKVESCRPRTMVFQALIFGIES
jgi:hypothetical protein